MDQALAVEAEVGPLAAHRFEGGQIVDLVVHAVQDGEAVGAGRGDGQGEGRPEGFAPRRLAGPRLLGQVVDPHDEGGEARRDGGAGDGVQSEDGRRCLDHRPQARRGWRAGEGAVIGVDVRRAGHLGREHTVRSGLGDGRQVRPRPRAWKGRSP